jgi:putative membrane protein
MMFLTRLFLNGIAILLATWLLPGLRVSGPIAALIAGAILGFVNAIVRPILVFLTFPLTLLTLGLFIFVINALCLALTAAIVPGFEIDGVGTALVGALMISIMSWILSAAVNRA